MQMDVEEARIFRVMGKACWVAALKESKTFLTKDQRVAHWHENKKEYLKMGRIILRQLEKSGYKISAR